jgi:hypothetical protein
MNDDRQHHRDERPTWQCARDIAIIDSDENDEIPLDAVLQFDRQGTNQAHATKGVMITPNCCGYENIPWKPAICVRRLARQSEQENARRRRCLMAASYSNPIGEVSLSEPTKLPS